MKVLKYYLLIAAIFLSPFLVFAGGGQHTSNVAFPKPLASYHDEDLKGVGEVLAHRIAAEPFNLVATLIFIFAIIHTFLAGKITKLAHDIDHDYQKERKKNGLEPQVSFKAEILHFFGEVEAIFGIWVLGLMAAILFYFDWSTVVHYINGVNYVEPMFVVVIMTLAATKPILEVSERALSMVAKVGGGTPAAWWFTILTVGPVLGSFITEPGAMTISAMLLAKQFYDHKPSVKFAYATIGLLFVNVSVGGTLSHFAAPPVLMVASKWHWGFNFMLVNFGWKALIGILVANCLYFFAFKSEFDKFNVDDKSQGQANSVPAWVILVHILFMVWTVFTAHYPKLFIAGFLFFLGFAKASKPHQFPVDLKPALLVGFFLGGLVTHGGLQGWWIAPILGSLTEVPLMIGATILTAFNDNAAITYLSTLVPSFSDSLKYAVVVGAVTGGGLTVIANAPNPAGQSILQKHFKGAISPLGLAAGALIPTVIMGLSFMLL